MQTANVRPYMLEQVNLDEYVKIWFYQTSNQFASSSYCIVCFKNFVKEWQEATGAFALLSKNVDLSDKTNWVFPEQAQ